MKTCYLSVFLLCLLCSVSNAQSSWQTTSQLSPTNAGGFGSSVAISSNGGVIAVGGPNDGNTYGATWVFTQSAGFSSPQKIVDINYNGTSASEGYSVSLSEDGSILAFGAPYDNAYAGSVFIYVLQGGTFNFQSKIYCPSDNIGQPQFGWSVSLSSDGNTLAVGGPSDGSNGNTDYIGAVWIFTYSSNSWNEVKKITPSTYTNTPPQFGTSVSLSSDASVLAVGGPGDGYHNNNNDGAVWIITSASGWSNQQYIPVNDETADSGDPGAQGSNFGYSVSLSSDASILAIGGYSDGGSGSVWIYQQSNGNYVEKQKITPSDAIGSPEFGYSVSLSSDSKTLVIGGNYDGNNDAGAVWIYQLSNGAFIEETKIPSPTSSSDTELGTSVAISSDGLTIIAGGAEIQSGGAGTAFVYTYSTITSAGGHSDPHFYGFHGEKMEVKRDDKAANQLFHLYCSSSITITTLFYEYPDKLIFMTKFWVRLGNTLFTLNLSTKPKILSSDYEGPFFLEDLGRFRINIEDGHLEWDDNKLRVVYKYLQINFSSKLYLNNLPYMNIDMNIRSSHFEDKVNGLIGRTLHKKLSNEEFEDYLPFKASVSDIISFSCGSLIHLF